MTAQEAIERIEDILSSEGYQLTSDDFDWLEKAKEALEKKILKKPYKITEHKQNDYYCPICKRYLGDEMELKYACLQPSYCEHCSQALDWSDTAE